MKHLLLLRHGHSAEKIPGKPDKDRALSGLGINQALAAGSFLKKGKLTIDSIISSTADRAKTTAELVAERISFNSESIVFDDEVYQASVGTLLKIIRSTDNYQNILIVGHNPAISYFSEYISGSVTGEMGPGDILVLRSDIPTWKDLNQGDTELIEHFIPGSKSNA